MPPLENGVITLEGADYPCKQVEEVKYPSVTHDQWVETGGPLPQNLSEVVVEPKTSTKFPAVLSSDDCCHGITSQPQELTGIGLWSVSILRLKTINIYAFGFYINPYSLRDKLSEKYGMVSPSEINYKSSLYEDLLRNDVEMTVRLVVHYNRLNAGMVRSAFEKSLRNRLRKIERGNDDNDDDDALRTFCSYFTENLCLRQGSVIIFQWLPGGRFHTQIEGSSLGIIHSHHFCCAFFDLYIGDLPVCTKAKQEIGEKVALMLKIRE